MYDGYEVCDVCVRDVEMLCEQYVGLMCEECWCDVDVMCE